MAMNRRNVLIGLGTVAAGGGAALGTGAFSQVEADRTVSVATSGDSSAFLGIEVNGDYATDDSGNSDDAVLINLGQKFNDDATTKLNEVLKLSDNTKDSSSIEVGFDDGNGSFTSGGTTTVVIDDDGTSSTLEAEFNIGSDSVTLGDGTSSTTIDVTVRAGSRATLSETADPSFTIRAVSNST